MAEAIELMHYPVCPWDRGRCNDWKCGYMLLPPLIGMSMMVCTAVTDDARVSLSVRADDLVEMGWQVPA